MALPVTAILSRQGELAAKARRFTNDSNEAGLLVAKVMFRALDTFKDDAAEDLILSAMRRDLDRLIEQMRRSSL